MIVLSVRGGDNFMNIMKVFSIIVLCLGVGVFEVHAQIPSATSTQSEFSLMTWNIHKGQDPNWVTLVNSHLTDILVLQEATDGLEVLPPLQQVLGPSYYHLFNSAWEMLGGVGTGTLTSAKFSALDYQLLLSQDREPIAMTPKSMLVSKYVVAGCAQDILVVNLHMINFNLGAAYRRQLEQLRTYIENHNGPVVVAGDFNNWNFFRTNTMYEWAHSLGLLYAEPERRAWFFLDHIFYKNLALKSIEELETSYSDHYPLKASFTCS